MRISATGNDRSRSGEQGFTLVELMVVMSIIAVASAAVLFSLPDKGRTLRDSAERFAAQAATLRDAAVMDASPKAIRLDPAGYHFEHFTDGAWAATTDKPFRPVPWPDGVRARMLPTGEARIRFDATGLADPSTVSLSTGGQQASVTIDAGGEIRLGQ
jgi:general secretion pathway protein H